MNAAAPLPSLWVKNQDLAAKDADKVAAQVGMAAHRSNQDLVAKEADKTAA